MLNLIALPKIGKKISDPIIYKHVECYSSITGEPPHAWRSCSSRNNTNEGIEAPFYSPTAVIQNPLKQVARGFLNKSGILRECPAKTKTYVARHHLKALFKAFHRQA